MMMRQLWGVVGAGVAVALGAGVTVTLGVGVAVALCLRSWGGEAALEGSPQPAETKAAEDSAEKEEASEEASKGFLGRRLNSPTAAASRDETEETPQSSDDEDQVVGVRFRPTSPDEIHVYSAEMRDSGESLDRSSGSEHYDLGFTAHLRSDSELERAQNLAAFFKERPELAAPGLPSADLSLHQHLLEADALALAIEATPESAFAPNEAVMDYSELPQVIPMPALPLLDLPSATAPFAFSPGPEDYEVPAPSPPGGPRDPAPTHTFFFQLPHNQGSLAYYAYGAETNEKAFQVDVTELREKEPPTPFTLSLVSFPRLRRMKYLDAPKPGPKATASSSTPPSTPPTSTTASSTAKPIKAVP